MLFTKTKPESIAYYITNTIVYNYNMHKNNLNDYILDRIKDLLDYTLKKYDYKIEEFFNIENSIKLSSVLPLIEDLEKLETDKDLELLKTIIVLMSMNSRDDEFTIGKYIDYKSLIYCKNILDRNLKEDYEYILDIETLSNPVSNYLLLSSNRIDKKQLLTELIYIRLNTFGRHYSKCILDLIFFLNYSGLVKDSEIKEYYDEIIEFMKKNKSIFSVENVIDWLEEQSSELDIVLKETLTKLANILMNILLEHKEFNYIVKELMNIEGVL